MIRIFDKNTKIFNTLGLGSLKDAIVCVVFEELNGGFELELEYPIIGSNFDKIQLQNIIFVKPNSEDEPQAFRIFEITKPLDGIVKVKAAHISYDLSGHIVLPFYGVNLDEVFGQINSRIVVDSQFSIHRGSDKTNVETAMASGMPMSFRSLLAGQEGSILDTYGGEYKFNNFNITLYNRRGTDRGFKIKYGKNLTELEQETNANELYTGIFPYYYKESQEINTEMEYYFQEVFIKAEAKPYHKDWLMYNAFGMMVQMTPIAEDGGVRSAANVQVKTDGPYINKILAYRKAKKYDPYPTITNVGIADENKVFKNGWLSVTPVDGQIYKITTNGEYKDQLFRWSESKESYEFEPLFELKEAKTNNSEIPFTEYWLQGMDPSYDRFGTIYKVTEDTFTDEPYINKKYIWNQSLFLYEEYSGDGFYYEQLPVPVPQILRRASTAAPEIKVDYFDLTDDPEFQNGVIFLEGHEEDELQNIKIVDITSLFEDIPDVELFKTVAENYILQNKLRNATNSLTVSFVKISDDPTYAQFKSLEKVCLGDTVEVEHGDLNIKESLKVIQTEYNVLLDSYNEITLGTKVSTLSDTAVRVGDPISDLQNSEGFVNELVAQQIIAGRVNASFIETVGLNVIGEAIIDMLTASKINITGLLEASSASIQTIITDVLEAGTATFTGDVNITEGSIDIGNGNFKVDNKGNIKANSIELRSDPSKEDEIIYINIGDAFEVQEDGSFSTKSLTIDGFLFMNKFMNNGNEDYTFKVDDNGDMQVNGIYVISFIDANEIITQSITTSKVIFQEDGAELYLDSVSGTIPQTQVVTFTVTGYIGPPDEITGRSFLHYTITADKPLFNQTTLTVSISFKQFPGPIVNESYDIVFPSGSPAIFEDYISLGSASGNPVGFRHISVTPSVYNDTQTVEGLVTLIKSKSHIYPSEAEEYDLGSSDYIWRTLYAQSTVDTSDRKRKKDISYDISKYDRLFDLLKPTSYKFINDEEGKTHFGFIAQDIEESMNSIDISTDELSLVSKDESKKKSPEENSEKEFNYGLSYAELHALEIRQIQMLKERIDILENLLKKKRGG